MAWKNEQIVESDLEHWPGHIVIPVEMLDADFTIWWETVSEQETQEDARPNVIKAFETRRHLIRRSTITDPDGELVDLDKPFSMRLKTWMVVSLNDVVDNAQSLPKSLESLNGSTNPEPEQPTAKKKRKTTAKQ